MNTPSQPTVSHPADRVPDPTLDTAAPAVMPAEDPAHAAHGAASEVSWPSGRGRQPYTNQGKEETHGTSTARESSEGDRAERSGRNLDQLEAVKRKP